MAKFIQIGETLHVTPDVQNVIDSIVRQLDSAECIGNSSIMVALISVPAAKLAANKNLCDVEEGERVGFRKVLRIKPRTVAVL